MSVLLQKKEFLTIKEASLWASEYLKKNISSSNISYLIQYGRIEKFQNNNTTFINKKNLISYYKNTTHKKAIQWRKKLGNDLNWNLSFEHLKEKDTTKHVHRLHPYKGKFIPQLVEYFIDNHTDDFKKKSYFQKGDILLDPFCGSGTALVQSNELGIHAIGVDISNFNSLITNIKLQKIDFTHLKKELEKITVSLKNFVLKTDILELEEELLNELKSYNKKYFSSPEFKIKLREKSIIEKDYIPEREEEFLAIYEKIVKKYKLITNSNKNSFIDNWYLAPVKDELFYTLDLTNKIKSQAIKNVITIILSRTMRSCRTTTHADLATLKHPVQRPYYCQKHGKICKPIFSILSWWIRYSKDTLLRLKEFEKIRTNTYQYCLQGDSKNIDLFLQLKKKNKKFAELAIKKKIKGIFSSPPYVGLIDYHQQHAYAYELFGFCRNDELEIGPLFKGQGLEARKSYIKNISQVLKKSKKYLQEDYDVFLVANDKYKIYPTIAEKSEMIIVNQYKRPVLNRTEKDKSAYAEIIFHLKEKNNATF